jgi:PAS domain-containing protein
MADNLTVQISADSSKLRADLALAQSKVRDFGKEVKKAADEARKTGDTTRLREVSAQYEAAAAQVRGLNREMAKTTGITTASAKGFSGIGTAAAAASTALAGLVRGFGVTAGITAFLDVIGKAKNELLELNRISLATGFDPGTLKAVNETLEDTGAEAGSGYRALTRLSQAFAEVRQEARNAGEVIGNAAAQVRILRGGEKSTSDVGVNIMRGGQKATTEIKKASDAFKTLEVDMRQFRDNAEGNKAALQAIIDGFARLRKEGKIDQANLAAQQLFSRNMKEIVPVLDAVAKSGGTLNDVINELKKTGRYPDPEAIARAIEYQKAQNAIGDAVDRVGYSLLRSFGSSMVKHLDDFAKSAEATRKEIDWLREAGNWLAQSFVSLGESMDASVVRALDRIYAAAQRAYEAVKALPGTVGAGDMPPMPLTGKAAGGMIRGPGSGTSDSILARLSNGEFVMRAAAVRAWGPQLLGAMNALNRPLRGLGDGKGFADGGMVTAGRDGAIVNLHFPGGSFALRGDKGIVMGLTREARRAALLSGGRLPGAALA